MIGFRCSQSSPPVQYDDESGIEPETRMRPRWYMWAKLIPNSGESELMLNISFSRRAVLVLGTILATVLPISAADSVPSTAKLNKSIDAPIVFDLAGKPAPLFSGSKAKANVIVFLSLDCPVSNSYSTTLADLSRAYADKGVAVIGVLPTDDPVAGVAKRAAEFKLPFPVMIDPKLAAADAFKAVTTPEAFEIGRAHV